MKMAILTAKMPGTVCASAIRSRKSSRVIHFRLSTSSSSMSGTMAYPPPMVNRVPYASLSPLPCMSGCPNVPANLTSCPRSAKNGITSPSVEASRKMVMVSGRKAYSNYSEIARWLFSRVAASCIRILRMNSLGAMPVSAFILL